MTHVPSPQVLPLLTQLQPHWPPQYLLNIPGTLLPQGRCTDHSLCPERSSSRIYLANSFTSFKPLLISHLLNEVYLEHPVLKLNLTHPKLLVPITLIYPLLSVTCIIFQCAI